MSFKWRAQIEVWPHSTGNGREVDTAACGGRVQTIEVVAPVFADAVKLVDLFRAGIETNPLVWQAPLMKLERAG